MNTTDDRLELIRALITAVAGYLTVEDNKRVILAKRMDRLTAIVDAPRSRDWGDSAAEFVATVLDEYDKAIASATRDAAIRRAWMMLSLEQKRRAIAAAESLWPGTGQGVTLDVAVGAAKEKPNA